MITNDKSVCQHCDGRLIHYDSVKRIVRTKVRKTKGFLMSVWKLGLIFHAAVILTMNCTDDFLVVT